MSKDKKKNKENDKKKKGNGKNNNNHHNNNGNKKKFTIPKDMLRFAKMTAKKFKKENDFYDNKKDLKKAYYGELIGLMPTTVECCVRYGHFDDVKEIKPSILEKLADKDLVKAVTKAIKNEDEIENIEMLPVIIGELIAETNKYVLEMKEQGQEYAVDIDDITELSKLILKKSIKKLTKKGIDENIAFDILSVLPTQDLLSRGPFYYIRMVFAVLYEHAKTKTINLEQLSTILKQVVGKNNVSGVITFALLEKKDRLNYLDDAQKALFNTITEYCFTNMEEMESNDIKEIIQSYIQARKKDAEQNRDGNRRYYISSLPAEDYPKIMKVVNKIMTEENKKFL